LCTELIQSHADIDYEAMNLLSKTSIDPVLPVKTKGKKVHNENN